MKPRYRFSRLAPGLLGAGLLLAGLGATATPTFAQGFGSGNCTPVSWNLQNTQTFAEGQITWFSLVTINCTDGTRIQTDSAVVHHSTGQHELIGRVRMTGPDRTLLGDRVDYNDRSGVLFARGSVNYSDPVEGTELTGDSLWFQAAGATLPDDDIRISGRQARATFPPGGAPGAAPQGQPQGASATPYVVTADHMRFQGSRFFWAGGEVEVVRDSLHAAADSLVFNQDAGELILIENSSLESGSLLFTGDHMILNLPSDILTGVVVTGNSRMETEEMLMVGGEIRVSLQDEQVERIVAVRRDTEDLETPRPYVVAEEVFLMSDSIDVNTPGEVLERIYAVGGSWSERRAPGDSLPDLMAGPPSRRTIDPDNPPSRDWIEGDSIEVGFTSIAVEGEGEGGSQGYEISYLDARGAAGSFYRSSGRGVGAAPTQVVTPPEPDAEPEETPPAPANRVFDYIRAEQIRMTFEAGEATHVEAVGRALGVHVELPPLTSPTPDMNEESDD